MSNFDDAFGLLKIISDPKAHEAKLNELRSEHDRIAEVTKQSNEARAAHNAAKEAADEAARALSKAQLDHSIDMTKAQAALNERQRAIAITESSLQERNQRLGEVEERLQKKERDLVARETDLNTRADNLDAHHTAIEEARAEVLKMKEFYEAKLAAAKHFISTEI